MPRLPRLSGFSLCVIPLLLALGGILLRCSWGGSQDLTVRFRINAASQKPALDLNLFDRLIAAPADPLSLDCYLLNVTGFGVSNTYAAADLGTTVSPACLGLGTVSSLVSSAQLQSSGVSLQTRAGANRRIQLLGLGGTGSASCAIPSLATVYQGVLAQMYELGSTTTNLYQDTTVTIQNTYGSAPTDLTGACRSTEAGAAAGSAAIAAAFSGTSEFNGSPNFFEIPNPLAIPRSSPSEATMQTIAVSAIQPGARFVVDPTQGVATARVDLLVPTDALDLSQYRSILVEATGAGGAVPYSSGSCGTGALSGNGYTLRLFLGQAGRWSQGAVLGASNSSTQNVTFSESTPSATVIPNWSAGLSSVSDVLYVSVRANNAADNAATGTSVITPLQNGTTISGPVCSVLQLEGIQVSFLP